MQTLLDGIAARLSSPVVLDDERQRLIAYTDHDATADDVRVASILARRATPEVRIWFEQWGILDAAVPVRTPADSARQIAPRWVVPLRHEDMLLGFVSVLDRGRLTREQLEPAMEPAAAIAEALYAARRAEPRVAALLQLLVLPSRAGDPGGDVAAIYPHTGPIAVVTFDVRLPDAGADGLPEILAAVRHACQSFPANTALYAEIAARVVALVPLRSDAAATPAIRLAETVIGRTADVVPGVIAGISSGTWTASSAASAYGESTRALRIVLANPAAAAISSWDRAGAFRALTLLPVAGDHDPIDPTRARPPRPTRTSPERSRPSSTTRVTPARRHDSCGSTARPSTSASIVCPNSARWTSSAPATTGSRPTSGCASRRSRGSAAQLAAVAARGDAADRAEDPAEVARRAEARGGGDRGCGQVGPGQQHAARARRAEPGGRRTASGRCSRGTSGRSARG